MIVKPEPARTGRALAVRAERIDTDNWLDDVAAAPQAVSAALGLAAVRTGDLAMVRSAVPLSHFNMVMTLGCPSPADEAAFAAIDAFYAHGPSRRHWVLVNDHSEPADLAAELTSRGYAPDGEWDRVVLQGVDARCPMLDGWQRLGRDVEIVTPDSAADWVDFVRGCYGMPPPIGAWLHALVGRPGWMHAIRREGGHPRGPVVMARSLFCDAEGWAWLGIDAPVPGVMAPCFDDDQRVTAALLAQATFQGCHAFVSDIEKPCERRDSEAYARWLALGFEAVYRRRLYVKG